MSVPSHVCDNWWPASTITNTVITLSCQTLCSSNRACCSVSNGTWTCANWLPDIEEIGNIKSCTNQWPPYIINTPRTELRPPS